MALQNTRNPKFSTGYRIA